jgi:hypothetical protein
MLLNSVLVANTHSLYILGSDPMENMSIAQQRMSYCCHARLSGKVFTARCIATIKAQTYREHCFHCCVFVGTCLLSLCLAMGSPGSIGQCFEQIRHNMILFHRIGFKDLCFHFKKWHNKHIIAISYPSGGLQMPSPNELQHRYFNILVHISEVAEFKTLERQCFDFSFRSWMLVSV